MFDMGKGMKPFWFNGEVVDKDDPTNNGRVRVRCFGIHPDDPHNITNDKESLDYVEDQDLPWAMCINGTYGKIHSVPDEGDWVFGFFADGRECQHPMLLGTIPGMNLDDAGVSATNEVEEIRVNIRTNPTLPFDGSVVASGYPSDMTQSQIENIIRTEAGLRGIDPEIAVKIYRAEGAGSYQSNIIRTGIGEVNGREASFGPFQLFTGGGLGNDYENKTGRSLISDNTREGVTNQIRYSLDEAAIGGWGPWYGRNAVGVGTKDGLAGAVPIENWS